MRSGRCATPLISWARIPKSSAFKGIFGHDRTKDAPSVPPPEWSPVRRFSFELPPVHKFFPVVLHNSGPYFGSAQNREKHAALHIPRRTRITPVHRSHSEPPMSHPTITIGPSTGSPCPLKLRINTAQSHERNHIRIIAHQLAQVGQKSVGDHYGPRPGPYQHRADHIDRPRR